MEELHEVLGNFVKKSRLIDFNYDGEWAKLRSYFIDLINRKIIFEPKTKTLRLMESIRHVNGFKENLGESILAKVFPTIKYKFHLDSKKPEKSSIVKVCPPTGRRNKSARTKPLEIKEIDLSRVYKPKPSSRRCSVRKEIKEPPKKSEKKTSSIRIRASKEKENEVDNKNIINTHRKHAIHPLSVHNIYEAMEYVVSADKELDEHIFHYGVEDGNKYNIKVMEEEPKAAEFKTITKRGIFDLKENGKSEFTNFDRFALAKTQFNLLKRIQFFEQFKLFKNFRYWRMKMQNALIAKKIEKLSVISWSAMKPFPKVFFQFRKIIQTAKSINIFPFRDTNVFEFDLIRNDFDEAEIAARKNINYISNNTYSLLDDFSFDINDKYNFITTTRSINYLEEKKIPADLFTGRKCFGKSGLSLTEDIMKKEKKKMEIEITQRYLKELDVFMNICDKNAIETFIGIFRRDIKKIMDLMIPKNFEKKQSEVFKMINEKVFKVFLVYTKDSHEVSFSPSLQEMQEMFDEHLTVLFREYQKYVRPLRVDTSGKRIMRDENYDAIKTPLRVILKNDPEFLAIYNRIMKAIKISYEDGDNTLNSCKKATLDTYKFLKEWPQIKAEGKTSVFIKNITLLYQLKETVEEFKMTYFHFLIKVDVHSLKNDLLKSIDEMIEENNNILFQNFRVICEKIVIDIQTYIDTLVLRGTTLEDLALFNLNINNANAFYPEIKENVKVANAIFNRAVECGDMLIAILENSLKSVHASVASFEAKIKESQAIMTENRGEAVEQIKRRRKIIYNKIGTFERQLKRQFTIVDTTVNSKVVIKDIIATLEKIENLKSVIKEFEVIASRLNYTEFDFSSLAKTENELIQQRTHWENYQDFIREYNEIIGKTIVECNIPRVIDFINSHDKKELMSIDNPLYSKMADMYGSISDYITFFTILSKIEFNEERWINLCKILGMRYDKIKKLPLDKFLSPVINNKIGEVRSYIINLQQREDLLRNFKAVTEEFTNLSFKLIDSPLANSKIISFPSVYESKVSCENFVISIKKFSASPFFSTIEEDCKLIEMKIKQALSIITALIEFQTDYMKVLSVTKGVFDSFHFPTLLQKMHFVASWYKLFINQLQENSHVLSLIQKSKEQLEEEAEKEKYYYFKSAASVGSDVLNDEKVSNDTSQPIADPFFTSFGGDFLIRCLNEAKNRCEKVFSEIGDLLEQVRCTYPRLYFCSDSDLIKIMLAYNNIKFSADVFRPIFPSISMLNISTADTEKIIGLTNTRGEMYLFSSDFPIQNYYLTEFLKKIEVEMKNAVKSSINESFASREYTDFNKWINSYPLQSILVAESAFFFTSIKDILVTDFVRTNWSNLKIEQEKVIARIRREMRENKGNMHILSMILALKLRHHEIASKMLRPSKISGDDYEFKRHIYPVVNSSSLTDLVTISVGNESINYGYELISDLDVPPLSDKEEEAMINFAVSLGSTELSICKQYGGNRRLIKVFADLVGLPFFSVDESCFENIFKAVAQSRVVVELKSINKLTTQFSQIFKYTESEAKYIRGSMDFKKVKIQKDNFLIHIGTDEIPTWLKNRYRPIYLRNDSLDKITNKLKEIRKDITISEDCKLTNSVDIFAKAIVNSNARILLQQEMKDRVYIKNKVSILFDLPNYLLTGNVNVLEFPTNITIPENITRAMESISNQYKGYDINSSRFIANGFPAQPYDKPVMIYSDGSFHSRALALTAFGEEIGKVKCGTTFVSNDVDIFSLNGFRSLNVEIHHNFEDPKLNEFIYTKELTLKEFGSIIAQESSIQGCFMETIPYIENFIAEKQSENIPESLIYNELLTKVNLLRYIYTTDQSISMSMLVECIFTDNYKRASIQPSQLVLPSLASNIPIVFVGEFLTGKIQYAKKFINEHKSEKDKVIYTSPFNEMISHDVIKKLMYITKGKSLLDLETTVWVCIFDYEFAVKEVQQFVKTLAVFRSIYSDRHNKFFNVKNIQLVITTTNSKDLLSKKVPLYLMKVDKRITFNTDNFNPSFMSKLEREKILKIIKAVNKPSVINKFLNICTNNKKSILKSKNDFLRAFSIFFNQKATKEVFELLNEPISSIVELQNRNFNLAGNARDFNFSSIIHETVSMGANAIVVLNNLETSCFKYVKNTKFVILDPNFKNLLFETLVNVSQSKNKTTFIVNINNSNLNEVLDYIFFFNVNVDSPESSTQYSVSDLNLFRGYINNKANKTLGDDFRELMSYISFLVVVDSEETLNKLPVIFTNKMIILRPNQELNKGISEKNVFIDKIMPYIEDNIDNFSYNKIVNDKIRVFNEKFQFFTEEVHLVLQFFNNLTTLKEKIELDITTDDIMKTDETDLTTRVEQIQRKIKEAEDKRNSYFDTAQKKAEELQSYMEQIYVELPNCHTDLISRIKDISCEDQIEQIKKWLAMSGDLFPFINIFKDLFGFLTTSDFFEINPMTERCNLTDKIMATPIEKIDPEIVTRLSKYHLEQENQLSATLKSSNYGRNSVSTMEYIDLIIGWLNIVVKHIFLIELRNKTSAAITASNDSSKKMQDQLNVLNEDLEKMNLILKKKNGSTDIPEWMMKVWKKDPDLVKKLFTSLADSEGIVYNILHQINSAGSLVKPFVSICSAYNYGFCELPIETRTKILNDSKLQILTSPFEFITKRIVMELIFPLHDIISLFTQCGPDPSPEMICMETGQYFNTSMVLDQILLNNIVAGKNGNLLQQDYENDDVIPDPLIVFYDPLNIVMQAITVNQMKSVHCYSSDPKIKNKIISYVTQGNTAVIQIDSVESGTELFRFIKHIQLQLNSIKCLQSDGQKKPVTSSFRLVLVTTIPKEMFHIHNYNILFADFSLSDPHKTQWFELATVFEVNKELSMRFFTTLVSVSQKTHSYYSTLKKLSESSRITWPEYFENPQKMNLLQSTLSNFINISKGLNEMNSCLKNILENEIPKYSSFIELCRELVDVNKTPYAPFHVITSLKIFSSNLATNKSLSPIDVINKFDDILLVYVNCLPAKEIIPFISKFEAKCMKSIVPTQHLVLEESFPSIYERASESIYPQLINQICTYITKAKRDMFTFHTAESIPEPINNPVVLVVDDLIPTDYVARFIAKNSTEKTITLASFNIKDGTTLDGFDKLVMNCAEDGTRLIIVCDEMLPSFILPFIVQMSHMSFYFSYYIIVSKSYVENIRIVTNALYVNISMPYTMKGFSSFIDTLPINFVEINRNEGPLVYFMFLLSHRRDFSIPIMHILPLLSRSRSFWQYGKNSFDNEGSKDYWRRFLTLILKSSCSDTVTRRTIAAQMDFFFKGTEPSIPGITHLDVTNDTVYTSEVPPSVRSIGMSLSPGEPVPEGEPLGWKNKLMKSGNKEIYFSIEKRSKTKPIAQFKHVYLSNALWNEGELAILGEHYIDELFAYGEESNEQKKPNTEEEQIGATMYVPRDVKLCAVGVYDSYEFLGFVDVPCSGNLDQWNMTGVRLYINK